MFMLLPLNGRYIRVGTYRRMDEMPSEVFGRLGFKRHRLPRLSLSVPRTTVGVEPSVAAQPDVHPRIIRSYCCRS